MVTTGRSWAVSFVSLTFGTSTCSPYSITCAVSMKMISNTSTTSTNGVTLISDSICPPPRRRDPKPPPLTDNAMSLSETTFRHIEEFERKIVHARPDFADRVAEIVIENRRRDGREKPDGGRDERLRDAGSHRLEAG